MEIKRIKPKPVKGNHPRKCPACNSWLKNQLDGPPMCLPCYYRAQKKEQAERAAENVDAPVKPNVRIGTL